MSRLCVVASDTMMQPSRMKVESTQLDFRMISVVALIEPLWAPNPALRLGSSDALMPESKGLLSESVMLPIRIPLMSFSDRLPAIHHQTQNPQTGLAARRVSTGCWGGIVLSIFHLHHTK